MKSQCDFYQRGLSADPDQLLSTAIDYSGFSDADRWEDAFMCQLFAYYDQTKWSLAILLACLISLSACSSSSDKSPADDDPGAIPNMPENLTFSVYSSHEAELFWTASTDDGWVMGYDIFRDDVLIKERLDANSFFEANLEPATTYQYRVVAVDDDGNRSIPTVVTVTTLAGQAPNYTINKSTFTSILANVFDVFTGRDAYVDRLYTLPGFTHTALEDETIGCENEGTAVIALLESDRHFTFDNCLDGSNLFDGLIKTIQFYAYQVKAEGFSKVNPAGTESLSGMVSRAEGYWGVHTIDYEIVSDDASFHLTSDGFGWSRGFDSGSTFTLGMWGEFSVTSDMFATNAILSVEAENLMYSLSVFEFSEMVNASGMTVTEFLQGIYLTAGSMTVSAPDGSSVLLDSATGNPATVTVTLSNAEGSVSLIRYWATWRTNLQSDVVGSFR